MTIDERFDRIEHVTAGLAEERRKDREENRQIWRDTQRQINELTFKIADTNDVIARLADESSAAIEHLRKETSVADQQLRERIDSLVSAIGEMLRSRNGGTQ